jgi:hypothetical protein
VNTGTHCKEKDKKLQAALEDAIKKINQDIENDRYDQALKRIKQNLQICYQVINQSRYPEEEYELFGALATLYPKKDYPKALAIYQYMSKIVDQYLNGNQKRKREIEAQIQDVEKIFLKQIGGALTITLN